MNRNQAAKSAIAYINFLRSTGVTMAEVSKTAETATPEKKPIISKPPTKTAPPAKPVASMVKPAKADVSSASDELKKLAEDVRRCTACELSSLRKNTVFGVGSGKSGILFVGEAPGANEDEAGEPFVGRAGQLLTRMIEAIGHQRNDVFIANVLKCRPPENRDPKPAEVAACEHFLKKQIAILKPLIICTLGKHATQTLLQTETPIGMLRGKLSSYNGVPLLPTYHPSFLLRAPQYKKLAWDDLQLLRDEAKRLAAGRDK